MLHEKLECYREAVRLAEDLSKEVATWPRGYGFLSDQLKRALTSVVTNIAEGNARRSKAERHRFFEIARASAAEVGSCVDLAKAFGIMTLEKFDSWAPLKTRFLACHPREVLSGIQSANTHVDNARLDSR